MDDQAAIQALCEFVGNDLNRLTNEFDKLLISVTTGRSHYCRPGDEPGRGE